MVNRISCAHLCIGAVFALFLAFVLVDAQLTPCTPEDIASDPNFCGPRGNCAAGHCLCQRNCNNGPTSCGNWADGTDGPCSVFVLDAPIGNCPATNNTGGGGGGGGGNNPNNGTCTDNPQICGLHGNCQNGTCVCHKNCDTPSTCGVWFSTGTNGLITVAENSTGYCDVFAQCQVDLVCEYCNSTVPVWGSNDQCGVCSTDKQCSFYDQINLVSDLSNVGINTTDTLLVNPWGMAAGKTGPWYVTNAGTGTVTSYNSTGGLLPLIIQVPSIRNETVTNSTLSSDTSSGPTGIAFNFDNTTFVLPDALKKDCNCTDKIPAKFILSTLEGTIQGYFEGNSTVVLANRTDAIYTGMTIYQLVTTISNNSTSSNSTDNSNNTSTNSTTTTLSYIMAANYAQNTLDIFDGNFTFVRSVNDTSLNGTDYTIFNVANVNGTLYVMYALQNKTTGRDQPGEGNGIVAVYDFVSNKFTRRISSLESRLNSPWGVAVAPDSWGVFSSALLVSNFGDGRINAYNATSGEFLGTLRDRNYRTVLLDRGLWDIKFGNDSDAGKANELYFVSGVHDEEHGLFGKLVPGGTCSSGQCEK